MKQSDLVPIIAVGVLGFIISYFLVGLILHPEDAKVSFNVVNPISSVVEMPNPDMFNTNAINPTVEIYIGNCEDVDRDGVLSDAEKVACNEIDSN